MEGNLQLLINAKQLWTDYQNARKCIPNSPCVRYLCHTESRTTCSTTITKESI